MPMSLLTRACVTHGAEVGAKDSDITVNVPSDPSELTAKNGLFFEAETIRGMLEMPHVDSGAV